MADIFIGKAWHWALLVIAFVVLGVVGKFYLHTYAFNTFTTICLAIGVVVVLSVVLTYKPGDRITREPLEMPEE
jgi:hypothetical protein